MSKGCSFIPRAATMLAACCIFVPCAMAQTTELPNSLGMAIEQAIALRLDVRSTFVDGDAAQARLRQAQGRRYPSVDVVTELKRTSTFDSFTGVVAAVNIPTLGESHIDVTSSVPRYQVLPRLRATHDLYVGGRSDAEIRQAEVRTRAAEMGQQIAQQKAAAEVSIAYFKLRRVCVDWTAAASGVKAADQALALSTVRHEAGRLSDIEYRTDQLALTERLHLVRSRALAVRTAYSDYAVSVTDSPRQTTDTEAACKFDATIADDLRAAAQGQDDDPAETRRSLRLEAAQQQIVIEQSASRPQLALFAEFGLVGRSDTSVHGSLTTIRRHDFVVGLRLSYNLFDGHVRDARVHEARAEMERQRLQQAAEVWLVEQRRQSSRDRAEEAAAAQLLALSRLELASSRRALSEERYASGSGSQLAVEESRTKEEESRNGLNLTEIDKALAEISRIYASVMPGDRR